jgi:hypothetical protein
MNIFNDLSSVGITPTIIRLGIISVVLVIFLGSFWKQIVFGAVILFVIVVFSTKSDDVVTQNNTIDVIPTQVSPIEVKQYDAFDEDQKRIDREIERERNDFMTDCRIYGKNSKKVCESLWNDRAIESELEPN